MDKIENLLNEILKKLDVIIANQTPPYKGLGNPLWNETLPSCIGKDYNPTKETPLPSVWNGNSLPSVPSDVLYKPIDKPTWYNINNAKPDDLTNELYS
jgi:hypothetical protein